jgi:cGMP-dependent protein kinase
MGNCSCFEGATGGGAKAPPPKGARGGKGNSNLELEKQRSQSEIELFHTGLDFIAKVELFKTLPLPEHPAVARAFQLNKYSRGQTVIKQGDQGDRFFCIKSGTAKVTIDGQLVNKLGPGDYFGEMALLHSRPRNATIEAEGDLECHELSAEAFDGLGLRRKLRFKKRHAVIQSGDSAAAGRASAKTPAQAELIRECLRRNVNIGPFIKGMADRELQEIVDQAFPKQVSASETEVITQKDTNADLFYILESGTGEAIKDGVKVASYQSKDSFGGLALLYQAPRAATVRVTAGSMLWCIPRGPFRAALQHQTKQKVAAYAQLLDKVRCLKTVSAADKRTLADALLETTFYKDEFIYKEGDSKDPCFYILQAGEIKYGGKTGAGVCKAQPGQDLPYFGEAALLNDAARTESVVVMSEKATVLVLQRNAYRTVVGGGDDSQDATANSVRYNYESLRTVGLLGCGGFGKVTLVKDVEHGDTLFALKALSKGHVLKEGQQKSVMNEKKILKMTSSPFLVQVAATFNRNQHLMFLLEPAMGGELFTIYIKNKFYGNEKLAMFYSACVLRGLQHLHERCIIYRDMKPENLLLDVKGYCKIADFGLAKFVIGKTFTTCGTPDYFAPELLKGIGHTVSLDWWTLGILIYEFMKGVTPFQADDPGQLFSKMMKGIETADFPRQGDWPDLVKRLCTLEPSERLPVRPGGVRNVESHAWYAKARYDPSTKGFDWAALTSRTLQAPWDPNVKKLDCSNFDASEDDAPPEVTYRDPGDGWDKDFEDTFGPATFG